MLANAEASDASLALLEIGAIFLGLAVLARLAARIGLSPIPAYLLAGLALGRGGLLPLDLSERFVAITAEIGVVLLLFALGLEYRASELGASLRRGLRPGLVNLALNFPPGVFAGLLLGWEPALALVLGGVTYVTSTGVMSKVLRDLGRLGNRETPTVLLISVSEDLTMAVYLPLVAVILAGETIGVAIASVALALAVVVLVLVASLRYGHLLSRLLSTRSDEALLLGMVGTVLLVAALAQRAQVSAAIGAFLVGIAVSGPVQERIATLVTPLRDLFAATFFLFFGLQTDPGALPPVLVPAVLLAVVTAGTKIAAGWYAARRAGIGRRGRWRAGTALVPRGEFAIVLAGLAIASGTDSDIAALTAAYVMILAVAAPVVARLADRVPATPR